jgi:pimeloyl-ACP methyl ester carboxylesterase
VQPEDLAVIARHFPAHRMVALEGAGHWPHADRPRDFHHAMKAFLLGEPAF